MLNKIILLILLISSLFSETLEVKNITFTTENDSDFRGDNDYTYGSEISILFYRKDLNNSLLHIPFTDYKLQDNYISFSYAHQIYTPEDLKNQNLILNDRPYAGYMYFKSGLYQSYNKTLKSLVFQLGMLGPSTNMDRVQEVIHANIGSDVPEGWDNQLKNELVIQINYGYKEYMELSNKSVFIPEYGFELGNASTKVFVAGLYRWGDIPKDYGSTQIDNTNANKIPLDPNRQYKNAWSYCLNLSFKANLIARDIFLDGNTFLDSHNVDKNIFVAEVGYGVSVNYGHLSIDYLRKHLSHQFKTQNRIPNYGSLVISYNF
ncbi:lipid A deacylase LpxR family protein [Sulfurimonas marina]|uniref:Lipid A deacylase LpxR family protein n=1 Tax=Sulfurimonas marina TaxID=2590551 RepID=A0A7M3V8X7_9BACT|nr:lipid A deacylase LpxR family protein [Sulfurimonas marina]QOP40210.1 lipid A deacylase LpxR family protein [Sulfurimonas marina]